MKTKLSLTGFFVSVLFLTGFSQDATRPLFSLTIIKSVNNESKRVDKFIEIDSLGNIFNGRKKTGKNFDIKVFSKEITKYVVDEKLHKYPGNDDISFIEPPTPKINKQTILISIKFLDDFNMEKDLRNKTYYSWGEPFDKEINDYPLFKYLTQAEIDILKALLE
jgi:hypothetical protein